MAVVLKIRKERENQVRTNENGRGELRLRSEFDRVLKVSNLPKAVMFHEIFDELLSLETRVTIVYLS